MITIDKKELEEYITTKIVEGLERASKAQTLAMKAHVNQVYCLTAVQKKELKETFRNGATYADTDSIKVEDVSRETFYLTQEEIGLLKEVAEGISNECGQVSCDECWVNSKNLRFGYSCLAKQLDELRRNHTDYSRKENKHD